MQTTGKIENEKGALTLESSGLKCIDLFFKLVRGVEEKTLIDLIKEAWKENALDCLKIMFNCRDCRGGKGERKIFKYFLSFLLEDKEREKTFLKNFKLIPFFGRWDDLLFIFDIKQSSASENVIEEVSKFYAEQLFEDLENLNKGKSITLCAKWSPSEKNRYDKKSRCVSKIIKHLSLLDSKVKSKKDYRKIYLSPLRSYLKIVEIFLCKKEWDKIDYSKVPGVAMKKLKKCFQKNDKKRFEEYLEKLVKGEKKVNAATIEACDLVKEYIKGAEENVITEKQYEEIVKRVKGYGSMTHSLCLSDVSGSMSGQPMEVSVALGILISGLTDEPFKNKIITFDSNPTFFEIKGNSLKEKVKSCMSSPWGGSTNFIKCFELILNVAIQNNLPESEMPSRLYIISDMQFDEANSGNKWETSHEKIEKMYKKANYKIPEIVYWNVRANTKGVETEAFRKGVALISGYSSSIIKSLLMGKVITPYDVLRKTIDDERYSKLQI